MNDQMPHILDDDDDLRYLERSTLSTFVDESQLAVLLTMWQNREAGDNNAFMRDFVDSLGLPDDLQTFPEGDDA